jgi:hypothetical protein
VGTKLLHSSSNSTTRLSPIWLGALACACALALAAAPARAGSSAADDGGCQLESAGHRIKHVVFIQFDNVHLHRDNPNVPSDLEQMPHLLNFLEHNGTLLSEDHTVVISHTAAGFITTQNGVYPDRDGLGVSNSFRYYNGNATQTTSSNSSFAYWTDPLNLGKNAAPNDTSYVLVDENGHNAPAPWVPFTRAGCRVGYFGMNGPVLENTSEIPLLFPPTSQAFQDFQNKDPDTATNYVGVAVHCPKGDSFCSTANGGISDVLPNEPNGYSGFNEVLGNRYIAPQIGGTGAGDLTIDDFNGNPIGVTIGGSFVPGFNSSFDGLTPPISLAYAAAMQEHGIPVTYTYISDAHDNQLSENPPTFGPGEAGYVAQLKLYDQGFADFFASLAAHGIDSSNTLFVVTADEGDHFVGSAPSPANCDGVTIPCTYSAIGEVDADYPQFVASTLPSGFGFHSDSAPVTWATGKPASTDPNVRTAEQTLAATVVTNPFTNASEDLFVGFADAPELSALHQASLGDPARVPTFIPFGSPDYFFTSNPCGGPALCVENGFAWNHGDIQNQIAQVFLGMVGPGVEPQGLNNWLWADHTDVRPTMLALLGLKDDYQHDGRVLVEALNPRSLPPHLAIAIPSFAILAEVYKQINAPFGSFGSTTLLGLSRPGIASTNPSIYSKDEALIASLTAQRNALGTQIRTLLENTEFGGQPFNYPLATKLTLQSYLLLAELYAHTGGNVPLLP